MMIDHDIRPSLIIYDDIYQESERFDYKATVEYWYFKCFGGYMEVRFICNTCKKQIINKIHPNYPHVIEATIDLYIRATGYLVEHQNHHVKFKAIGKYFDCWNVTEEDL